MFEHPDTTRDDELGIFLHGLSDRIEEIETVKQEHLYAEFKTKFYSFIEILKDTGDWKWFKWAFANGRDIFPHPKYDKKKHWWWWVK